MTELVVHESDRRFQTNDRWKQVRARLANSRDVPDLKEIMLDSGVKLPDFDWGQLEPYWIIAHDRERAVAACQLCYGKPFAQIVFIEALRGEPQRTRAIAVKKMLVLAAELAARTGAQFLGGAVSKRMNTFRDILAGRGSITVGPATMMLFDVRKA